MTPRTMSAEDEHTGRQVSPRAYAELDAERAVSADLLAALKSISETLLSTADGISSMQVAGSSRDRLVLIARAAIARAERAK